MPPKAHALLGASSAERWIACPPSARLTEHMPDAPSAYAAEGTEAHALCERVLRRELFNWRQDADKPYSLVIPDEAPDEMRHAAETYVAYIRECWLSAETEPSVFIEQRVDYSRWVPEGFGTCDCLLIHDGRLHIFDFKYGAGVPVSPEDNAQMQIYALGALAMFEATDTINTIDMTIIQPRVTAEPMTATLTAAELLDWADKVLAPAAKLAWEGKGEYNPGEAQCRWCKAYPTCRAWADRFQSLDGFSDPNLLSDDEIGPWLTKLEGIAAYAADLKDYAQQRLLDGGAIPGYKLIEGRGVRQWTDQDAAFAAIKAAGIAETMLYNRTPITLTAAEKLLGKKRFETVCGGFVDKPAGAPKIAPESDKHPAYNPTEGFTEVTT
jgi:hypothetical protein